jgi:hypothetical protein
MKPNEKLFRIIAPPFSAEIVVRDDRIVRVSGIFGGWKGERFGYLQLVAAGRKWRIEEITNER